VAEKQKRLQALQKQTESPDLWKNREQAVRIGKEITDLEQEIKNQKEIEAKVGEIQDFLKISGEDEKIIGDIEKEIRSLEKKIERARLQTYLGGEHDRGDAILQILVGAGGRESQDWVAMLKRMYERYAERKGFLVRVLDQSFGEPGGPEGRIGIKNLTLEINGKYAFGFLRNEAGVHRLVRISPFSAQKLRHTSFAQVVVLPRALGKGEFKADIDENDLKIETFRSSGPGGQYMQKTESAVRITHLPTKTVVRCQSERSQAQNKKKAMEVLSARLYQLKKQKTEKDLKEMKGDIDPAWGRQVRNYILDKRIVKDLRTGVETVDVESVLNGDLDEFIEAGIKIIKGS